MQQRNRKSAFGISHTGKIQKQRQIQLAEIVQEAIADIIQRNLPYEIEQKGYILSVNDVEMNSDLKIAHVYIISIGQPDDSHDVIIQQLQKIAPTISKQLGRKIKTRYTPKILFHYDKGVGKAQRIYQIFDKDNQNKQQ